MDLFSNLIKITEIFENCYNVTDNINNIINPYSLTFLSNNINLDLLQIAILYSQDALSILLKNIILNLLKTV